LATAIEADGSDRPWPGNDASNPLKSTIIVSLPLAALRRAPHSA
jgi:hypothetical protein